MLGKWEQVQHDDGGYLTTVNGGWQWLMMIVDDVCPTIGHCKIHSKMIMDIMVSPLKLPYLVG